MINASKRHTSQKHVLYCNSNADWVGWYIDATKRPLHTTTESVAFPALAGLHTTTIYGTDGGNGDETIVPSFLLSFPQTRHVVYYTNESSPRKKTHKTRFFSFDWLHRREITSASIPPTFQAGEFLYMTNAICVGVGQV
jgi:hypothetical protein